MTSIGGIGGGMGSLGGIGGAGGLGGSTSGLGGLGGVGSGGSGIGGLGSGTSDNDSSPFGITPTQRATDEQGASFSDTLKDMLIDGPSRSKAESGELAVRLAAGENVDPHQLAIASAKAGVEIQMATRTISSTVSAVRTLFQMQI